MEWDTFVGHSTQRAWFENALARNRVASTFLLVGQEGIGKRTFAKLIAKSLLCTGSDARKLDLCNRCETCKQVDAGTHPDVIEIAPEKDKSRITMRQLVGEDENRLREGLCYEIRFHPYSGRRKFEIGRAHV